MILLFSAVLAGCLSVSLAPGCSSKPTGEITGNVICGGMPVLVGEVMLQDSEGHCVSGAIDHGHFAIYAAPVGTMQVTVTGFTHAEGGDKKANFRRLYSEMQIAKEKAEKAGKTFTAEDYEDPNGVPKKYSAPKTSGLTFEVKPGRQNYDLELDGVQTESPALPGQ